MRIRILQDPNINFPDPDEFAESGFELTLITPADVSGSELWLVMRVIKNVIESLEQEGLFLYKVR